MTTLPTQEIEFLATLPVHLRNSRLAILHSAGWSLASLARSVQRPKTTVYFWVNNSIEDPALLRVAVPQPRIGITSALSAHSGLRIRFISPKVPPDLRPRLRELSMQSRRYRARTPESSNIAKANRELTVLAVNLHAQGVSTADIADAAGVSYRAMARRIEKGRRQ